MTRLLWVTDMAHPAPRNGGGIRSLRLVRAAAREWPVDVVNVAPRGLDEAAYLASSGASSVRTVAPPVRSRAGRAALALRRALPLPAMDKLDHGLGAEVGAAAARGDVVVVEHGWMLGYVPRRGRVVVVLHNVDSELAAELPGRARRWNVLAYRRLERSLVRRRDAVVTVVSERDATLVGPGAVVVPNGADLPREVTPVPASGTVLFVGSMGYPPNVAAVEWWARAVWPGSGLPPLTVVGQAAASALAHLAGDPAVDLVGEVPSVAPELDRARVVVVPVVSGSGTRLKVVEALAHHRPVVATTKGAEGTGAVDGTHVLLADHPAAFAAAVRRLLSDDALAASLAAAGREFAWGFRWEAVGETFVAAVRRLTG